LLATSDDANRDWFPFENRTQFEVADFLYQRAEMSGGDIDNLLRIWEASLSVHDDHAPFLNHRVMYRYIDAIPYGEALWRSFTISYTGDKPLGGSCPSWMNDRQCIWYRDPLEVLRRMIANPDFAEEFDYTPYHEYSHGVHQFCDFMSGDWAWKQAVRMH
jgi:hypothetical protein